MKEFQEASHEDMKHTLKHPVKRGTRECALTYKQAASFRTLKALCHSVSNICTKMYLTQC